MRHYCLVWYVTTLVCFCLFACAETGGLMTTEKLAKMHLKDGVYDGEYKKFPFLKASSTITIKGGEIQAIAVPSYGIAPSKFKYRYKIDKLPDEMVKTQSIQVDYITGATQSSFSVMQAVQDAVNKAVMVSEESM